MTHTTTTTDAAAEIERLAVAMRRAYYRVLDAKAGLGDEAEARRLHREARAELVAAKARHSL